MEKSEMVEEKTTKTTRVSKNKEVYEARTWKEVFKANYNGTSEEAKELQPFLKDTYKGDVYIPWAVMERLVYMMDEDAEFVVVHNDNGGIVHTDCVYQEQKNIQKGEVVSETSAPMFAHFVTIVLKFMGKTFVEHYPIQDQDYSAARIYNQNLVNRAIQRGKTKVASRATGLGLRLYEGFDLQFDTKEDVKPALPVVENNKKDVKNEEKPAKVVQNVAKTEEKVAKTEEKVEKTEVPVEISVKAEEEVKELTTNTSPEAMELVSLIKTTEADKMTKVLQSVNVSIMKKYSFALSVNDTEEELIAKVSQFPDVTKFTKAIRNLLG